MGVREHGYQNTCAVWVACRKQAHSSVCETLLHDAVVWCTTSGLESCKICFTGKERDTALKEFFEKWKSEPLVLLKWIGLQVRCMGAHGKYAEDNMSHHVVPQVAITGWLCPVTRCAWLFGAPYMGHPRCRHCTSRK